jgi:hypothetical protein
MTGIPEDDLDPIRRMILNRAAEMRLSLADLSREVGKNNAYVQQFIWRGSPKRLPDTAIQRIASALQIPEAALRDGATPPSGFAPPAFRRVASSDELPVFVEGGACDPAHATGWTLRVPPLPPGGGAFAVWVRRNNGRVKPGDMIYVQENPPPRPDDVVVLISGGAISAIGNLDSVTDESATIGGATHRMKDARILKVAIAKYA